MGRGDDTCPVVGVGGSLMGGAGDTTGDDDALFMLSIRVTPVSGDLML